MAVFGLGGVGLSAVMGARIVGATTIVAIDVVPDKFELAHELGATTTLVASDEIDATEVIATATGGGVDYAFDAHGLRRCPVQGVCRHTARRATVIVGLPDPSARVSVSPAELVATERTPAGHYMAARCRA